MGDWVFLARTVYAFTCIAGNTSCYSWGNFIAGISRDSLTPYSDDANGNSRVWQETINGTGWTDNPQLVVECDRFKSQGIGTSILLIFVPRRCGFGQRRSMGYTCNVCNAI